MFTKYKSQVRSTFLFVSFSNEFVGSLWTASIAVSRSLLRGTSHGGEGSLYVWTVSWSAALIGYKSLVPGTPKASITVCLDIFYPGQPRTSQWRGRTLHSDPSKASIALKVSLPVFSIQDNLEHRYTGGDHSTFSWLPIPVTKVSTMEGVEEAEFGIN